MCIFKQQYNIVENQANIKPEIGPEIEVVDAGDKKVMKVIKNMS